jgi:hypothetical protein
VRGFEDGRHGDSLSCDYISENVSYVIRKACLLGTKHATQAGLTPLDPPFKRGERNATFVGRYQARRGIVRKTADGGVGRYIVGGRHVRGGRVMMTIMVPIEICTDSPDGPYLIAPDDVADALVEQFAAAAMTCRAEKSAVHTAGLADRAVIVFAQRAVLGPISMVLNEHEYEWTLNGLETGD